MPQKYEFWKTGILIRHWGVVTGKELIPANRAIYDHQFKGSFMFQLADLSNVTNLRMTSQEIKSIAEDDSALTVQHPQLGIVVIESNYIYGMCRMWNMIGETESFQTMVARNMGDAIEFLHQKGIDIEKPTFPDVVHTL